MQAGPGLMHVGPGRVQAVSVLHRPRPTGQAQAAWRLAWPVENTDFDTEVKVLTTTVWIEYIKMFTECGMEVYETNRCCLD